MLISLVACFIAAGSFIGYNFADNNHNMDVSLADISVMAQADGELPPSGFMGCREGCQITGVYDDFCFRCSTCNGQFLQKPIGSSGTCYP